MAPPSLINIVDLNEIIHDEDLGLQALTNADLEFNGLSEFGILQWLAKRKLVKNAVSYPLCRVDMSLILQRKKNDGFVWRCKYCRKEISVRDNSFFNNSHLKFTQILIIMYGWSMDFPQKDMKHMARLSDSVNYSIVDWCSFCRDICQEHFVIHPSVIGGVDPHTLLSKTVEIDESKYFHRKYHRGQWTPGHWVFGGIERGSRKCFMVVVPDRRAETLLPIIERCIRPGTIIVSDGWRAYRNIDQLAEGAYEHRVVIHQQNFVDPGDPEVHTQNLENMWMRSKRKLKRQFGTSDALFPSYLDEFKGQHLFTKFVLCVQEQYQL